MDIDVEHEGQRTKVTPPSQSGGAEGNVEMEMDGGGSEGSKVSTQYRQGYYRGNTDLSSEIIRTGLNLTQVYLRLE